jgi:uncharacterized protein YjiS (DUF1127 family)
MYRSIRNVFARVLGLSAEEREIRQAIRELGAYSDRELNELGLTRAEIPHVVRYGRPERSAAPATTPARKAETAELPRAA